VHFSASVSDKIPWQFRPLQREVTCVPGEPVLAFFNATNNSDEALIGISTYNVTPQKAGVYFNKIQCFCFEEQQLQPHESVDMPVFFFIDPDFVNDANMESVDHLTLSYTFFKVVDSVHG
jgi:cytochrome c oxidase assembly protein subunit 11